MKKLFGLVMLFAALSSGCALEQNNLSNDVAFNNMPLYDMPLYDMPWQGVPGAQGHIVMVGGGSRPDSIMRHILQLSADNSMMIIPMASATPQQTGDSQAAQFRELGADSTDVVMLLPENIDSTQLAQRIASAKAIWFSGGDQNRLMASLGNGVLLAAVKQAYLNGAVIAGTSAGTAVISRSMITGDEVFPAGDRSFGVLAEDNVVALPGIGLLNNMIVDQHFLVRSRLNRLISVLLDTPEFLAAGIDEATALWIQPDGWAQVLGESQVILLQEFGGADSDLIRASYRDRPQGVQGPRMQAALDIRMSVLPPGSRFRLTDNGVTQLQLPD